MGKIGRIALWELFMFCVFAVSSLFSFLIARILFSLIDFPPYAGALTVWILVSWTVMWLMSEYHKEKAELFFVRIACYSSLFILYTITL